MPYVPTVKVNVHVPHDPAATSAVGASATVPQYSRNVAASYSGGMMGQCTPFAWFVSRGCLHFER